MCIRDRSLNEAIKHAGVHSGVTVDIDYIDAEKLDGKDFSMMEN